jgi:pimeloyl-ACP methyl ester carboxylesterase
MTEQPEACRAIIRAAAQAALLDDALLRLGVDRAVVVGHSWLV